MLKQDAVKSALICHQVLQRCANTTQYSTHLSTYNNNNKIAWPVQVNPIAKSSTHLYGCCRLGVCLSDFLKVCLVFGSSLVWMAASSGENTVDGSIYYCAFVLEQPSGYIQWINSKMVGFRCSFNAFSPKRWLDCWPLWLTADQGLDA